MDHTLSATRVLELRGSYSRDRVDSSYLLDDFGGAAVPVAGSSAFRFDLNSRNAGWMSGNKEANLQRQFNLAGSVAIVNGDHSYKFGADFRRLSPVINLRESETNVLFTGVDQALTGVAARINQLDFAGRHNPVFKSLSLFAQDEWKKTSRVNTDLRCSLGARASAVNR